MTTLAPLSLDETAELIAEAVAAQHPAFGSRPKAINRGDTIELVWEEGPYEWTYAFPYGGVNDDYGVPVNVPDVSQRLARHGIEVGDHFDAQTHYSLCVYKATETDWL